MALIHKKYFVKCTLGPLLMPVWRVFHRGGGGGMHVRIAHLLRRQQQLTVAAGISVVLDSVL